ncbi:hypothetical protein F8388_016043 [Cannabis sativa]|uniref:Polygalacturonase-inhibiting protein n=1 Tax=Cannabis sativa TaxID=3483 RepID=A0A7J6FV46_CANSA|nr:hypothetical protein F8388_016043 [Cannabis sativa]
MKSKSVTTIIFTLLFSTTLLDPSLSELCNQNDKKVLLQIKKAFNDPYVLTSWHEDTDCCDWYCVTCDPKTHRITALTVITGSLTGPIPTQVGDLHYLENLDLHKQVNLTGPIPPAIAKLRNLKFLRLNWNSLTGSVPDFLSQLTNLTFLDLSFNNLTGPIPASLSKLPNLRSLRLDRNKLTGSIPESFGEFKGEDFYLVLSHNQLSGKIPDLLGKKKDFANIDLSRNKLEGDPNALFGSDKTIQFVDLSRNLLEFNMSKIEFPKSLATLDLNHNKIIGSLPVGLTALDDLRGFNVSYNRLCGKIPVGGNLQSFEDTSYFHNRCLCGAPLQSCK